jgi:competence protein ComEC
MADGAHFLLTTDRSILEDRPWSPAPAPAPSERVPRPLPGGTPGADPADR